MLGRKKDEEKRSKAWRIVMLTSTIVIALVAVYFFVKVVAGNPLKGEWVDETNGYYVEIDDENELTLEGTFNGTFTEVELYYTMDKEARTITITPKVGAFEEAAQEADGKVTAQELDEALEMFTTSFEYSLENDTLTLVEREYADKYIFTRVK